MLLFDLFIYGFFAWVGYYLAKKSETYVEDNEIPYTSWDKYLIYFVIFFTIIAGIRWNVGADCLSYAYIFSKPDYVPYTKESLWWLLVSFIHKTGFHWTIGLAICGFVQVFFLTQALKNYRWLLVFLPFVFFGGRYWMDCMNAVRQMMVACGFVWASRFIVERKIWYYIAFVACASFIHQSALILLPFYFLYPSIDISAKRFTLIGILIACLVLGQTPAFQSFAQYFKFVADATDYEGYGVSMTQLLLQGQTDLGLSFGPMMLTYILIPIFIIWYGPEIKEQFADKIPMFNIWYNLAYFYACGYFLVCNISHLFIRPMMYFELFQMIMATILLYYLWAEYKEYGIRQTVTLLFCFVISLNTVWDVAKSSGLSPRLETKTYKTFIFHTSKQNPLGL